VFTPMVWLEFMRLLLGITRHFSWVVHHMDVKSTFLNGEIKEMVFVQ
jgi:hypothetical protein